MSRRLDYLPFALLLAFVLGGSAVNLALDGLGLHRAADAFSIALAGLLIVLAPLCIVISWRKWREYRKVARVLNHECTECGYNLTGNTSGVCPECGKAVDLQKS